MDKTGFEQVKTDVHRSLLAQLDLEKLSAATNGSAKQAVAALIVEILAKEKILLNAAEKDRLQAELLDEVFGLGPLEVLLGDPTISDIMVTPYPHDVLNTSIGRNTSLPFPTFHSQVGPAIATEIVWLVATSSLGYVAFKRREMVS